jgi:hypothetical protein
MYGPNETNWPQDVPEKDELRGSGREENDATRELRNKATQTLITHAKATGNYDMYACIKVSIRAGGVAVRKQRAIAIALTTHSVSSLNTGKLTQTYCNVLLGNGP